VHVHLGGGRPNAHERQHGEAHRGIYERGVDPAVQGARAVEVDVFHGDAYNGASWPDLLDLSSYVSREGDYLVKIPCWMTQLLFAEGSAIFSHQNAPFYSVSC